MADQPSNRSKRSKNRLHPVRGVQGSTDSTGSHSQSSLDAGYRSPDWPNINHEHTSHVTGVVHSENLLHGAGSPSTDAHRIKVEDDEAEQRHGRSPSSTTAAASQEDGVSQGQVSQTKPVSLPGSFNKAKSRRLAQPFRKSHDEVGLL